MASFLSRFWSEVRLAVAPELALLGGKPKLWAACAAIVAVPTVYSVTYLSSVWDPYGRLPNLPVALVNLDRGADFAGQHVDVGAQVMQNLQAKPAFAYHVLPSEQAAQDALDRGEAYFALVIPADFSARTLPGPHPDGNPLTLLSAPGTSYTGAMIGRHFASEVADRVNGELEKKRWDVMFADLGQLKQGVHRLHVGAGQLDAGAARLDQGAGRLASGAGRLTGGVDRLTSGMTRADAAIRLMASKTPPDADLDRMASGSAQLTAGSRQLKQGLDRLDLGGRAIATGSGQLAQGLTQIHAGSKLLSAGAHRLTVGVGHVPILGGRLSAGAGQLQQGASRLEAGIARAVGGSNQLAAGASQLSHGLGQADAGATRLAEGQARLDGGVQRLTGGLKRLDGGLRLLDSKLPADTDLRRLDAGAHALTDGSRQLAAGSGRLADGAHRIAAGLALMDERLAAAPSPAHASDLATPVSFREVERTHVENNGVAFAPYFMALSLWMGAVMTTFVFHFIKLPESSRLAGQRARMWAKGVLPGVIVLAQASVLASVLRLGMHVPVAHVASYYLICLAGSATFLAVLMALIMILGDAGKLLAIVLLVFQLGAAGGPYPVELSGGIFERAHAYLPISNLVSALRACLFGAYDGHWWGYVGAMAAFGWGAWLLAVLVGRLHWKYTPDEEYSTVLDI